MRIAIIDRIETTANLVELFVVVDGEMEGPVAVADPWGVHVELAAGQPVALFPLESARGEFVAVPMAWRVAGANRDYVALRQDIDSLNARVTALESNVNTNSLIFNAHLHNTPAGPMGVPSSPPLLSTTPPPPMPPSVTSATITGSNRHKVTHD